MTNKSCLFIVIFGWEMETHGIRTILSNIMNHMYVCIYIYVSWLWYVAHLKCTNEMIYKRHIYIAVTLLLQLEFKHSPVPTRHLQKHGSRRKLLGSDPRRVHGWRFCVLSPTGWGIHSLVWRVGERIFERDQWWLDLRFLFFCTGVLLDCVCVCGSFRLNFYLDTTQITTQVFFSSYSTSKWIICFYQT